MIAMVVMLFVIDGIGSSVSIPIIIMSSSSTGSLILCFIKEHMKKTPNVKVFLAARVYASQ